MRCIVQDLPPTIAKVAGNLPSDLTGKVSFMEHDFFKEQPVQNADILRALIPALKPGAKVVISEMCMPEYGQMPLAMQKSMDMNMKAQFNGKERDAKEWTSLLKRADHRFTVDSIRRPVRSKLSFIVATWSP
ncbi:O- family 2 protein [Rutstroemia sp. NJR-2017a WRK4]|nr:O- family 2 protein [Rutstroemia sp. NJR-2017a WRK4]